MKNILIALALLAACCTAMVPGEFRNLTTTEIDYNSHVQTLIPKGLKQVLETNEVQNQFNTTDFILDKINFVSQKEFKKGYIYKINVDFINSAGEIAHTQFIGVFKHKKFSIYSLTYDIEYPQMDYDHEEKFKPSPVNGTYSTGIFKNLRNYVQDNFNQTQGLIFRNATMYNSTYLPQDYNMSSTYDVPQNYSSPSYNNTWVNKTYSQYYGPSRTQNTTNNTVNSTNTTSLSSNKTYSAYYGPSRTQNTTNNTVNSTNSTYLSPNKTVVANETFGSNITESVYKCLNMLVDSFNNTNLEIDETDLDSILEPLVGTVFDFVSKSLGDSFGIDFQRVMADFIDLEMSDETMPAVPKKHKSAFD